MIRRKTIRSYEKGLYFKNREFKGILEKGSRIQPDHEKRRNGSHEKPGKHSQTSG